MHPFGTANRTYRGYKRLRENRRDIPDDFGKGHPSLEIEYILNNVRNWKTNVSE